MRRGRRSELLLAITATVLALLAVEVGFRVKLWAENEKTFDRAFEGDSAGVAIPSSGTIWLGHLIRPSRNPAIVYELKPNLVVSFQNRRVTTNKQGFRGPLVVADSSAGFRILGLGNSFMFGWGVADGEEYLSLLGQKLGHAFPDTRWEIINTAVPGYNTVMELATLVEKGVAYEPKIVVIGFVANDLGLPAFIRAQEPVLTLRKSFLASFVQERFRRTPTGSDSPPPPAVLATQGLTVHPQPASGRGFETDPDRVPPRYRHLVGWPAYQRALEELQALQVKHHFAVVSVFLSETNGALKRQAMSLSDALGFHVVDIRPALRAYMREHGIPSYRGSPLAISATDNHPSALAHRITAEVLLEYLIEHDLLDVDAFGPAP